MQSPSCVAHLPVRREQLSQSMTHGGGVTHPVYYICLQIMQLIVLRTQSHVLKSESAKVKLEEKVASGMWSTQHRLMLLPWAAPSQGLWDGVSGHDSVLGKN